MIERIFKTEAIPKQTLSQKTDGGLNFFILTKLYKVFWLQDVQTENLSYQSRFIGE